MKCPDCNGDTDSIALFARGWENPVTNVAADSLVHFTEAKPERSAFLSMFTKRGDVEATRCKDCHRIFLYGIE